MDLGFERDDEGINLQVIRFSTLGPVTSYHPAWRRGLK